MSLADRRKDRQPLIDQTGTNELGSELDRLKQAAETMPDAKGPSANLLEDIEEEDLPELDFEDEDRKA